MNSSGFAKIGQPSSRLNGPESSAFERTKQPLAKQFKWSTLIKSMLVWGFCMNTLYAQKLFFDNLTIADGLSYFAGNGSYDMLHDSRGYMWLVTNDGLNRFDGRQFRVFRTNADQPGSICNDYIISVCEDPDGKIWVGTTNGISVFDPDTELFSHFRHHPDDPHSLIGNEINFIRQDLEGNMWVGTRFSGVCYYSRKLKYFIRYPQSEPGKKGKISVSDGTSFHVQKDGSIWVGTADGLNRLDRHIDEFVCYQPFPEHAKNYRYNSIATIMEDRNGLFWTTSYFPFGNSLFNPATLKFQKVPATLGLRPNESMLSFFEDRNGDIWIGTSERVIRWNPDNNRSTYYQHEESDPSSILPGGVFKISEDREGNIWFLVGGSGFSVLKSLYQSFETCTSYPVSAIAPLDSTRLFLGTGKGIVAFDFYHNKTTPYPVPERLRSSSCLFMTKTSASELWVGDVLTQKTIAYDYKANKTQSFNFLRPMTGDKKGNVWTTHKLQVYTPSTKQWTNINQDILESTGNGIKSSDFKSIATDHSGNIWIGSDGQGVYRYAPKTQKLATCLSGLPTLQVFHNAIIWGFHMASNGWIYMSTSYGLGIYDPKRDKLTLLNESNGLPSRRIFSITEDKNGRIWLTTVKGISRLDPANLQVVTFDESNGLRAHSFMENVSFAADNGYVYFSTDKVLIRFHPDSLSPTNAVSAVYLNRFFLDHRPIENTGADSLLRKEVFEKKEVHLAYNQSNFGFEFIMPVIKDADKVQYFYMLEGYDRNWINARNNREVHYTNMAPGTYTVRARAVNGAGIPCTSEVSIRLIIASPWWATWWAYTLYALILAGVVYELFSRQQLQHRLKLEALESEKLKEVDQLKSRFFANISHEFRTPLTLILGQIDSLKATIREQRQLGQLHVADRNGKRLLELINQLLDLSKLEAGAMTLRAAEKDLVSFLKSIFFSMELLAEHKKIRLHFTSDQEALLLYFDSDKLEKICTNLMSNAWKFTPEGGVIRLSVDTSEPGWAAFEIADTGIGIAEENLPLLFERFFQADNSLTRKQQGTGIGLALVKELVELHHGEITVKSQVGTGTAFRVRLPLGSAHLKAAELAAPDDEVFREETNKALWIGALEAQGHSKPVHIPTGPAGKKRPKTIVLVVEDNPDVREFIAESLRNGHHDTLQASNGREGLEKAREAIPDLIVTDVMMPEMDGIEFSRYIRADERTSHIPVIMLTAKSGEEEKLEGLQTGVDDYLTKPFSARELLQRVNNLIQMRQLLRKRFRSATVIQPAEVSAVSLDQVFMEKVLQTIEANMGNEQFGVEALSEAVNMSVTHLNRKLKALIDQPAGNLIRSLRLQRAAELLTSRSGSVAEIAYSVGFSAPEIFSRNFKKQFNCTPLEYQKRKPDSQPPVV